MTTAHASARPARRWGRWVALGLAIAVVAFVGLFAWDFWQLKQAAADLQNEASRSQQAIADRDADALLASVGAVEDASRRFANATSGPHWWVADHVPWIRNQSMPLHAAGQSVLAISEGALGPLSELDDLSALEAPRIVDGRIDPYLLEPYRDTLGAAAEVMATEQAALADVSLAGTVAQVREPFLELVDNMATLGSTVQGAHVTAEVLPAMLGADEPRTYLVMVQNNAEPRTTGGIPGAVMELGVEDGTIEFKRYVASAGMGRADLIPGPLSEDEERIFTARMLRYPQDVNFTPEYSRSAELMTQYWQREFGTAVDGVISVDPVALGYMLQGMPATDVAGITITADTVASVMLNEAYLRFPDPEDSDAFFAAASGQLFALLVSGQTSSVAGVEQAIDEGRFLVWSADSGEQGLLATTPVAGGFLERTDAVGLFVNDGSGSKIGYYIDAETSVVNHMCPDGSLQGQTVSVTLTHTFGGSVAELPEYVAGGWLFPAGEFHANVLFYPATGTGIAGFTHDGEQASFQPESHDGRSLGTARVVLSPGEATTLVFDVVAARRGLPAPTLVTTPGPAPHPVAVTRDLATEGC